MIPLILLALFGSIGAWSQTADVVMVNGKVLTVDQQFSVREAIAIREGKIAAVGSNNDVRKLAGPNARVIDLQGRTVIPGLIDSHMHAIRAAHDLQHRGELDRRAITDRGAAPGARRCCDDEARFLADRCWRLDRATVPGAAAAHASRASGRGSEQSGLYSARLWLGGR